MAKLLSQNKIHDLFFILFSWTKSQGDHKTQNLSGGFSLVKCKTKEKQEEKEQTFIPVEK